MKLFFSFVTLLSFSMYVAQDCNCTESYNWMVSTFEKNDAGFQYVIDKKGQKDYEKHKAEFAGKVKTINKVSECGPVLYEWLKYFRPGHIAIQTKEQSGSNQEKPADEIRKLYKNEKTIDLTENQLRAILLKKKSSEPLEGIWSNESYRIGIIADPNKTGKLIGFILKADSIYWMPKQIKAEITPTGNKHYTSTYYMRNHSKNEGTTEFLGETNTIIFMNNGYWVKESSVSKPTQYESIFISMFKGEGPFLKKLSEKTLYLRIPSFLYEQKVLIDSVLKVNNELITKTPNLVIDIRNGTGGSDASYGEIMQYLYTNPIRGASVQLYATELNAQAYENYAKQFTDTGSINFCSSVAKKMRLNIGKFIDMNEDAYYSDTSDVVLPFPENVAIVCNENNGSTDEQFLLEAKQSSKVKVFGHPTGGMLDISNMNHIDFPDGKFTLGYCMSKSYRIPKFCIDGVGIQPDVFIDDGISLTDWIKFVQGMIEK